MNKIYSVLVVLLLFDILAWQKVYSSHFVSQDQIFFLDVGQGSASLIQTHHNYQILIDTGPDSSILNQLRPIIPSNDHTIELVIITHPHADHLIGLNYLFDHYQIKTVMLNNIDYREDNYQYLQSYLAKNNIPVIVATQFTDIKTENIDIDMLYPFDSIEKQTYEELNNSSIALKITSPVKSILITGDLHTEIEQKLIEHYNNSLQSDILVAGHHGSKTSTSDQFLELVNPSTVIISAGKDNQFGHPSPETIEKLHQKNIEIKRTDLNGSIRYNI